MLQITDKLTKNIVVEILTLSIPLQIALEINISVPEIQSHLNSFNHYAVFARFISWIYKFGYYTIPTVFCVSAS